jgi:hypothetical protein
VGLRCVAVDWSGRSTGAGEFIWLAEACDGELVFLENGRSPAEVVDWLIDARGDDLVVGLDFAFSFPGWYCAQRGWSSGPEVWAAMGHGAEALLRTGEPPFWGRPGVARQLPTARGLRRTERDDVRGAKSVFQIGGAGAVGTGSLRGMAHLATLRAAGFAIWPFDDPPAGPPGPLALEIYPRVFYRDGPIVKRRWRSRDAALRRWFPGHPAPLLERAAGSEDAFDAAVSALAMSRLEPALRALAPCPGARLEGRIWAPPSFSV